jgi:tripartite-type tricarboxylate transporter receptor subunit TctC
MKRRSLLFALSAPALITRSWAQSAIPDKAIRLMVGFGAGGGLDLTARMVAPQIERRIGRHVTVENRPGGIGAAAGEALKMGPNDSSLLALMPSTTIASRLFSTSFPFDPLVDTAPITTVGNFPMAIAVSPKIGVSTFAEYVDWMTKGDAGRTRMGCVALLDAFSQMYGMMFARELGSKIAIVDYRSSNAMVADLVEERVPAAVGGLTTLLQHHRGGRVKILVTTGHKRPAIAPDLPSADEVGRPGLYMIEWYGFYTGGRAPAAAVDAWNQHLRAILERDEIKFQLTQLGLDVETSTPDEARARVVAHLKLWKDRMDTFGMTALKD